ncbi:endonuclease-8 [Salinibacterium amurskyense]|uniref:DNA-(apurinic or apyrimidinic site) lyase n=1 Tax=Salinibacterium amurskyense TaxID=205941 RepID=A0A2M9D8M5_9MICO|nr:DNA-formamidopyrimidine glycosylase family protein [Salinibacterium amurskyense]PJJ82075.1 endonuclease-8 [Salinibacterium amurskyense]RLQ81854.1 Fpg/Nei family DNA glycosylase [Salinibacterium amurskyense]GHD78283.1 formamidopyrimidine-DNA glycosylase [Salinibacterium amurskyense]
MPEGHSVHRIARQFALHFVGKTVAVSSPQGRFAAGAERIDGLRMLSAKAVGKQMFLEFEHDRWLRVHLGLYGAWDFAGNFTADATTASAAGRMGQTNQHGTVVGEHEDSLASIGAPRRTRLRMSEQEKASDAPSEFPPEPIGAVRVRLLTDTTCADLRGPTACEVLTPDEVQVALNKLGPDPLVDDNGAAEERFVATVRKKQTAIGILLMDQSVVSGIGNVYRAEILFRARLDPHTPGKLIPEELLRELWRDWAHLLEIGVRTGQMMTMDGLTGDDYTAALASRDDRHWVYHREGLPCRVCGANIAMELASARKLYWCPSCQAPLGS